MSGRRARATLSVLLLLLMASLPAAVTLLPGAAAQPPVVSLEYLAATRQTIPCGTSCSTGTAVVGGASAAVTLFVWTSGNGEGNITQAVCGAGPQYNLTRYQDFRVGTFGVTPFTHVYLFAVGGVAVGSHSCGITVSNPSFGIVVWGYALEVWDNVMASSPIAQHNRNSGTTELTYSAAVGSIPKAQDLLVDWATAEGGNPNCGGGPCLPSAAPGQVQTFQNFIAGGNVQAGSTKGPGTSDVVMSEILPAGHDNSIWGYVVADINGIPELLSSFTYRTAGLLAIFSSSVIGGTPTYTYNWSFGDGNFSSSANPAHEYPRVSTFVAFLNVTDSGAQTSGSSQDVIILGGGGGSGSPPPSLPPANTVVYPQISQLNCNDVTLTDPRGEAAISSTVLWAWDFGDGSPLVYSPVPTVEHVYALSRAYYATMTTQDRQGNVQSYSVSVDTTPTGCGLAVIRSVGPPSLVGLFVALLVASYVVSKKRPVLKRRLRAAALGSAMAALLIVVVL